MTPTVPHMASEDSSELIEEFPLLEYYHKVLSEFEKVLHHAPADVAASRGKGMALVGLGLYDDALLTLEQAIALHPQAALLSDKAEILFHMNRHEEAILAYQHAIKMDITSARAYSGLYEIFENLGRTEKAQQVKEEAYDFGYEV